MKIILFLMKKAFAYQLFILAGFWLIWLGLNEYFLSDASVQNQYIDTLQTVIQLLKIGLIVWSLGYFFQISAKMANGEKKPLKPLFSKKVFIYGIRITFRLLVIIIPLILLGTILYFLPPLFDYYKYLILLYFVLVIGPYLLMITVKQDKMPIIRGLWTFFKQNASKAFAFVFWFAFSILLYAYFSEYALRIANVQVKTLLGLSVVALLQYLIFFYLLSFEAVLLGFFAQKTQKEKIADVETLSKVEEK